MMQFTVDQEKCVACGECARDCQFGVIVMTKNGPMVPPENETLCIGCQHCMTVCKERALSVLGADPAKLPPMKGLFPSPESMLALIHGRRSVRRYKKKAVDAKTLDVLMDAISQAPTGVNRRNGGFTIVADPAVMEDFRQAARERMAKIFRDGAFPGEMEFYRPFFEGFANGADPIFRDAPHMIIPTYHKDNLSGPIDSIIALSYFELLAQSMGLGTLWCGLGRITLARFAPDLCGALGIPEDQRVGYLMLFGHPAVKYHNGVLRERARMNVPAALTPRD